MLLSDTSGVMIYDYIAKTEMHRTFSYLMQPATSMPVLPLHVNVGSYRA